MWGFTDFHGYQHRGALSLDRSFSEYRLSHSGIGESLGISGLGLQVEHNALTGDNNDVTRFGLTYKHHLLFPWAGRTGSEAWLQWRVFPYETDHDGGQVSTIFYLPIHPRAHIKGFIDYNIADKTDNRWVIEPELNVQVFKHVWALVELRYNGYEAANPVLDGFGVAAGLRVRF